MQYIHKITAWRNNHEKVILKEGDQTFYISTLAAKKKADGEGKDLWMCRQGVHTFYVLRNKD